MIEGLPKTPRMFKLIQVTADEPLPEAIHELADRINEEIDDLERRLKQGKRVSERDLARLADLKRELTDLFHKFLEGGMKN